MDEIVIDDKRYISSKRAAKLTGYAKDYVGQLCREGRVSARLVGRSWYVLESAIQDHRFGNPVETNDKSDKKTGQAINIMDEQESAPTRVTRTWDAPRYEAVSGDLLPAVSRLRGIEQDKLHPENNEDDEKAIERLEQSWRSWFDRFDYAGDIADEPTRPEQDIITGTIGIQNVELPIIEEPSTIEEAAEVPVLVHSRKSVSDNLPMIDRIHEYKERNTSEIAKNYRASKSNDTKIGLWMRVLGIAIALVSIVFAITGSGYFDIYLISSGSPVSEIAGIHIYSK